MARRKILSLFIYIFLFLVPIFPFKQKIKGLPLSVDFIISLIIIFLFSLFYFKDFFQKSCLEKKY